MCSCDVFDIIGATEITPITGSRETLLGSITGIPQIQRTASNVTKYIEIVFDHYRFISKMKLYLYSQSLSKIRNPHV